MSQILFRDLNNQLFVQCPKCGSPYSRSTLEQDLASGQPFYSVCPNCHLWIQLPQGMACTQPAGETQVLHQILNSFHLLELTTEINIASTQETSPSMLEEIDESKTPPNDWILVSALAATAFLLGGGLAVWFMHFSFKANQAVEAGPDSRADQQVQADPVPNDQKAVARFNPFKESGKTIDEVWELLKQNDPAAQREGVSLCIKHPGKGVDPGSRRKIAIALTNVRTQRKRQIAPDAIMALSKWAVPENIKLLKSAYARSPGRRDLSQRALILRALQETKDPSVVPFLLKHTKGADGFRFEEVIEPLGDMAIEFVLSELGYEDRYFHQARAFDWLLEQKVPQEALVDQLLLASKRNKRNSGMVFLGFSRLDRIEVKQPEVIFQLTKHFRLVPLQGREIWSDAVVKWDDEATSKFLVEKYLSRNQTWLLNPISRLGHESSVEPLVKVSSKSHSPLLIEAIKSFGPKAEKYVIESGLNAEKLTWPKVRLGFYDILKDIGGQMALDRLRQQMEKFKGEISPERDEKARVQMAIDTIQLRLNQNKK